MDRSQLAESGSLRRDYRNCLRVTGAEDATPIEEVQFLVRSDSRVRLVNHLLESGPATRQELQEGIDASKRTVARSLQSLEERGWIKNEDSGYRLTQVGTVLTESFVTTLDTFRRAEELGEFLRWFPSEFDSPDFLAVSDATISSRSEADPYAPVRKQSEILRTASELRILLPSVDLEGTKVIAEQITDGNLDAETVVSPEVEETMESADFAPLIREMTNTGRSDIYVSRDELPIYLGLAGDGRVQIGVEDDEGFPRSLFETADERVREWGEELYRSYRERARPKPVEEF